MTVPNRVNALIRRIKVVSIKDIEKLSKKYSVSPDEFIKAGATLTIQEKKRELQIERLEILARYEATTVDELREKIKEGSVPEHPAWEDLIEIKNIDDEIREIDSDIRTLQET